ncbi:MAG: PHP domain-containing protein [Anditalea sp.]
MHLNCHTYFSFKYGTLSVEELVAQAKLKKQGSLALTDINSTSAIFPFIRQAKKEDIHPVVGVDFRNGMQQQYIGLAKNQQGLFELNKHLSHFKSKSLPLPEKAPAFENSFIIYPFTGKYFPLGKNEYLGVHPFQIQKIIHSKWSAHRNKLVLLQPATFTSQLSFNIHRLLRSIDGNILLSKLPQEEQANISDQLYSEDAMLARCDNQAWLIQNARDLLNKCLFSAEFDFFAIKNKRMILASKEADLKFLLQETHKGALKRYGFIDGTIQGRINKELAIIQVKNFVSYFLINYDIVNYARQKGYFYVGRGSGANSIVAYCLYITDVDPLELDLYFERFINLYRQNPPDFDIDFSWKDRDDIIAYIFNKYDTESESHVSLLATYTTFQFNSAIRELGKVFGLPKAEIEELIQHVTKPGHYQPDNIGKLILKYSQLIHGMPNHLSIHAGGILISHDPIHFYTATDIPPKGFPTSHFDMVVAEEIGFYKFDILSQRGLGHIRDTIILVQENQGIAIDIHRINEFKKDERIKAHLRSGHTMGAFYVESPAMRMLLAKLKADEYLGLVAASSIIRPGVARSGMMREYILRHRDPKRRKMAHSVLHEIMPETYGIMVYQEDVIKVAHYFAGLSFDEADVLRRGMSGKFRSKGEFQKIKKSFFHKALEKGREEKITKEVWYQIESFAGYSFAKGHSASFAVESYQSLYLKAHFPLEFMVGVINNFGGFYSTEFYFHELRMNGADLQPPHINESNYLTNIKERTVYIGFAHLKFLQRGIVDKIIKEREKEGVFKDLADFISRVEISLEQLLILIRIDAFRFIPKTKQEILWEAHFIINKRTSTATSNHLFRQSTLREMKMPDLEPIDPRQEIIDQMEILEFPLHSPFLLLKDQNVPSIQAKDLKLHVGQPVQIIGYLVTVKYTRTIKGDVMNFGTFIDRDGEWIDTVHFPPEVKKTPLLGRGIYLLKGKVTEEFNFYTLEITSSERLAYWNAGG